MQMLMFLLESLFWLWLKKAQQQNLQFLKCCRYHHGLYDRLQVQDNYHLWLDFIGTWFQKRTQNCVRQQGLIFSNPSKFGKTLFIIQFWNLYPAISYQIILNILNIPKMMIITNSKLTASTVLFSISKACFVDTFNDERKWR